MRLATRVALAAALAAAGSLAVVTLLVQGRLHDEMIERVDRQLEDRAETAPILAAVGERLAVSEINATLEGARVVLDGKTVGVGALPDDALPPVKGPGWQTIRADGENWRLHTVEVTDVPDVGDHTLVQFAAPLGRLDELVSDQRRSVLVLGLLATAACGAIGYGFGLLASRPLSRLRRDAAKVATVTAGSDWRMGHRYGAAEVDDIAAVLNQGLDQVAGETARRQAALESARSFTASATHELRTPLTSALADLDVARHTAIDGGADHQATIADARNQLHRLNHTLQALRELADAELADPSWFTTFDLGDQVATLVDAEARRHPDVTIVMADHLDPEAAAADTEVTAWLDGVRLACANLVRNAVDHGRIDGRPLRVEVDVEHQAAAGTAVLRVDDNGRGIAEADRERLLHRFERGSKSKGTGLGLALVGRIAELHGGGIALDDSPLGGLRAVVTLAVKPSSPRRPPQPSNR